MTNPLFSVWEGVFKSFEEAGGDLDAFDSDIWISKQKDRISEAFKGYKEGSVFSKDYPLVLVVAMLLSKHARTSILDLGGGMGMQYLEVLGKVPLAQEKIEYVIVDGETTLQNTPDFMKKFKNLHYHSNLDQVQRRFDVVHIGSTLQYIEDWQGLLGKLIRNYSPKYFIFSDLMVGNVPTFISHQIFYGKKIPHLFLNLGEFIEFLQTLHFKTLFYSKFIHKILNQEEVFPDSALPKIHRLDRSMNLVFYRK